MVKAREAEPSYVDYMKRENTLSNMTKDLGIFNIDFGIFNPDEQEEELNSQQRQDISSGQDSRSPQDTSGNGGGFMLPNDTDISLVNRLDRNKRDDVENW